VAPPRKVLMVCMGNICRSPTAEVVLRDKAKAQGIELVVDSVGTENYHIGDPPDARSIHHARLRGYDLTPLRARQISDRDFTEFDVILAADALNLREITRRCPAEHRAKLALFLGTEPLPDPYYGEAADFEKVLDLVEKRVDLLLASWWR
jgi:protein-tyrosine phosphatase